LHPDRAQNPRVPPPCIAASQRSSTKAGRSPAGVPTSDAGAGLVDLDDTASGDRSLGGSRALAPDFFETLL
jgi:hypothetical protein